MAINKVIYGNTTLIDLTSDTVTADKVLRGYTFHRATGEIETGTASGEKFELIVTCDSDFAGTTITCTDGITTLTQTCPSVSPYEVAFDIPNGGYWTISGTASGMTSSVSIYIPDELELYAIPNGTTVTPTDDIQIWLHCANIWDKTSYTTISDVLNDTTTFLALISNSNAVDYMARSSTWASSVCANQTAMTYIGSNDYCSDTLLADSTWCTSICNSGYFQSVLNVKVPTMTGASSPSGWAGATNTYSSYYPYLAFDNSSGSNSVWIGGNVSNQRLIYKFPNPVAVRKVWRKNHDGFYMITGAIAGSNDGVNYDVIKNISGSGSSTAEYTDVFVNNTKYLYYAINIYTTYASANNSIWVAFREVQFYGRE